MSDLPPDGISVDAVELRRIDLPLVTPFRTSLATWTHRDVLLVRVLANGPRGPVEGWGECVAPREPTYSEEYTAGCEEVTREHLLPRLFDAEVRHGAGVAGALAGVQGHRMAKAAIEAAVLDAELRAAGVPLASHLGATTDRVLVGASIGLQPSDEDLVGAVGARLAEGYTRIKIKIEPGRDVDAVRAVRATHGDGVALQVDANGSYRPDDVSALRRLDDFGLLLIEQPFPADRLTDHADLARVISTPVCLDESIVSSAVAADAVRLGAADVIAVKPGRVGGHLAGKAIHDDCLAAEIPVWHGGMLETGVGRAANLALAALPGFGLPADISAADRYWHRDIVTEPAVLEADGTVRVPSGPGTGVEVDLDVLNSVTTSVALHEADET